MFQDVRRSARLNYTNVEVSASRTEAHKNAFYITAASLLAYLLSEILNASAIFSFHEGLRKFLFGHENTPIS